MARVTIAEVEEILETSATDAQITAAITGANAMVTAVVGSSSLVGTSMKKEIERWLAAHMTVIGIDGRQTNEETVGPIRVKYATLGEGLRSTSYGQHVLLLDISGNFAALGGKKATLKAIKSFS